MKRITFILALALAPFATAQNINVQKSSAATNAITQDLSFLTGRTLNIGNGATLSIGTTTPATITGNNGQVAITAGGTQYLLLTVGGSPDAMIINHTAAGAAAIEFQASAVTKNAIGMVTTANTGINGAIPFDTYYRTEGYRHIWSVDGGTTIKMVLATTGNLLVGGLTTDGTGVLQFPASATGAGGLFFGTDLAFYRIAPGRAVIDYVGGTDAILQLLNSGVQRGFIEADGTATSVNIGSATAGWKTTIASGAGATAATFSASQILQLNSGNSFSAPAAVATVLGVIGPAGSHTTVQTWLTILDSGGATRYLPCF